MLLIEQSGSGLRVILAISLLAVHDELLIINILVI